ncbi:hypothetical protein ED733_008012 [Metarhizium rileyi]|uniref:Uncharacterized protein n=1 Tax=Metarhizium rileyi (strain RCEF 4871) TaxID=1649241 RepID=A0A5C6GK80_METRR|nr:hypothetical protein ED733_008012 [Metarhizium rileyi]
MVMDGHEGRTANETESDCVTLCNDVEAKRCWTLLPHEQKAQQNVAIHPASLDSAAPARDTDE